MADRPDRGRIVVGFDGSEHAKQALDWAIGEAVLRQAQLDVVFAWQAPVVVSPIGLPGPALDLTEFEKEAEQLLDHEVDAALERAAQRPLEVRRLTIPGGAAHALLELAKDADLLVVGGRGHGGFAALLLGSVSQQVVHHAPCPVAVIPAKS